MEQIYKYKFNTNCLNVNNQKTLNVKFALELCQQAAVLHGCEIGFEPDIMSKHKKFWVVSKVKLNFLKPIKLNETVEFISFLIKPTGAFTLEREYKYKVKGETRIEGTSKWCLVDTEKNSLAPLSSIEDFFPTKFPKINKLKYNYAKLIFDENYTLNHSRKVMFNDIDINKHCNNQKYVEMSLNCIPLQFSERFISSFEISYIKQCYYGNTIDVYSKLEENSVSVIGKVDNDVVFTSKIEFLE